MRNIFGLIIFSVVLLVSCNKEKTITDETEHFFLRNNKADMPVYVEGNISSGIFLIILHGGPGDEILIYRDLLNSFTSGLEKEYAVVYWGQRCSGSSQGNVNTDNLKLSDFVNDLEKLIVVLQYRYGINSEFFLIGHSWGGALGSLYLIKDNNQEKIKGWIEIDGAHNIPLVSELAKEMILSTGKNQIALGNEINSWKSIVNEAKGYDIGTDYGKEKINILGDKAIELMANIDSVIYKDVTAGEIIKETFCKPFNPFSYAFNGMAIHDALKKEYYSLAISDELVKIKVPSLFIWGKYDFYVPYQAGINAFNKIGSSAKEIVVFDKSEHWPMRSEPEKCRNIISAFIEKNK